MVHNAFSAVKAPNDLKMAKNTFTLTFEDGETKSTSVKIIGPKDVVMFVAGTKDPLNVTGEKHQANKNYWRNEEKEFKNLRAGVKALKPQFHDLHIEDEFFSWSGDNNNADRTTGAKRLLDLIYRQYPNWKNDDVYFHFIGHSHGGNVINEFTNVIVKDDGFPEKWKIKSITYLSTPFFQEQHQLNHTHLHADCKIINVHNDYDITQRFVADFSLKNLEILIANYNAGDFDTALNRIKETDFSTYEQLGLSIINNHTEGPYMWEQTIILLDGIERLAQVIIDNLNAFKTTDLLVSQKTELLGHFNTISRWARSQRGVFENNRTGRSGGYGRSEFFEDLDLLQVLTIVNTIFDIDQGIEDSYLLGLLDSVFKTNASGIVDKIDDTSWTPEKQVNSKFEIVDLDITNKDVYDTRHKKSNYDGFISGIENALKTHGDDKREVLMRLLSQLIPANAFTSSAEKLDVLMYLYTNDAMDNALAAARDNLNTYGALVNRFYANLITDADLENNSLTNKPGSLGYLAMTSHGLSHTQLFPEIEEALKMSFGSGKNPGFKG